MLDRLLSLLRQPGIPWESMPRLGETFLERQAGDVPKGVRFTLITTPTDIADKACAFGVPTFYVTDHGPSCFLKLQSIPDSLIPAASRSVRDGKVRMVPRFKAMRSYPIVGLIFEIPVGSQTHKQEAAPDLTVADVRDSLDHLLTSGRGNFYLLHGEPAALVAEGTFFSPAVAQLRRCLNKAAAHHTSLTPAARDYRRAVAEYFESTSL